MSKYFPPFIIKGEKSYIEFYRNTIDLVRVLEETINNIEHSKQINQKNVQLLLENLKTMQISMAITEDKIMEKLKMLEVEPEGTKKVMDSLFYQIENFEKRLEHKLEHLNTDIYASSGTKIEADINIVIRDVNKLEKMLKKIYKKKIRNRYIITDRDFIAVLEYMKKRIMFGKIKPLPAWAKHDRKKVIEDIGEKIQLATEVAVAKALTKNNMNLTGLSKNVPSSMQMIRKSIKRLEKSGKIKKSRENNKQVYKLVYSRMLK